MTKEIGFIGLGQMGARMVTRLLDAGYALTICDTRQDVLAPFIARGARAANSPLAVASAVDTVLVSLPTPDVVRQVALGENGIAAGGAVKTYVDLSTTGARVAQEVAAALRAKGITAIDAPVSGGVSGAQKGTLAVMTSGPQAVVEALRPVLEILGKVFYLGERAGLGQTMKLANNLLSATAMAITSEAMVMGVKAGLDPRIMLEVINAGTGRNSASQDKFPRAILPRLFNFGFASGLMYKDVKLCMEEAQAMGVPMTVGTAVRELWAQACERIGAQEDFTTVVKCVEQGAGVEVRAP